MDPLTIGLVAMTCSIIIAATNLTMCSLQSCIAVSKHYDHHSISNDSHDGQQHDHDSHTVELTGKDTHH